MKRYFSIEALRFLTSLSVLMYHYRHFFSPLNLLSNNEYESVKNNLPFFKYLDWLYTYGFFGVHIFYTISGFVFAHVYLYSRKNSSLKEFAVNRIARLYPLHFATLIFVSFFQILFLVNHGNFQFNLINDFYHFFLQIFFISSWGFENGHSFNAPIWSVSVEVAIYVFFFYLINIFKKYDIKICILLSVILIVIDKLKIFDTLFLECARLFFSGVLVFYIINYYKKFHVLTILSLFLIILSFTGNFKTFVFCPAIVLFFLSFENLIKSHKVQRLFSLMGNLTYALYLLHVPLQLTLIFIFEELSINISYYSNYLFFIAYFAILFILAHITFTLYEKPMNKLLRKRLLNEK